MQDGVRIPAQGYAVASYPELIVAVRTYRLENGLPVGNVQQDVFNFICGNWPIQCTQSVGPQYGNAHEIIPQNKGQRFVDELTQWGIELSRKSVEMIPEADAYSRALRCQQCSNNVVWENQCPHCVTNARRLFALIRKGKDMPNSEHLHACKSLKMCLKTACYISRDQLPRAEGLPENCWCK